MSAKEAAELKGLQVRLQKADAEESGIREELNAVNRRLQAAMTETARLRAQIKSFTAEAPVVTEHALLRYIERVMGVDLDALRAEILNPSRAAMVKAMGSGKIDMKDGRKIVFKNRAVVTIE